VHGSCGCREPGVGRSNSLLPPAPAWDDHRRRPRFSGKLFNQLGGDRLPSLSCTGAPKLRIMRVTVRHPSGVYPA